MDRFETAQVGCQFCQALFIDALHDDSVADPAAAKNSRDGISERLAGHQAESERGLGLFASKCLCDLHRKGREQEKKNPWDCCPRQTRDRNYNRCEPVRILLRGSRSRIAGALTCTSRWGDTARHTALGR